MKKHILTSASMEINFDDVFGGPPRFAALILASPSGASSSAVLDKATRRTPSFKNSSLPVFDLPVFGDDSSSRGIICDSRANSYVHGGVLDEAGSSPGNVMVSSLHGGSRSKPSSHCSSRRMSPVHPASASFGQSGGHDDRATNKTRPAVGKLSKQSSALTPSSLQESRGKAADGLFSGGTAHEAYPSSVLSSLPQLGSFGHQKNSTGVMDGINIAMLQSFVDSDDLFGGYYPPKNYPQPTSVVPHTSDIHGVTLASNKPGLKSISSLNALASPDSVEIVLAKSSSIKDGREHSVQQDLIPNQIPLSGPKQLEPTARTTSFASHGDSLPHVVTSEGLQTPSSNAPLKYKTWKDLLSEPPSGKSFTSKRKGLVVPPGNELGVGNDTAGAFVEEHTVLQAREETEEDSIDMEEREMQALLSNAWKYNKQAEREHYNTKFPIPKAKISGKQMTMSHTEQYEPCHVDEKGGDVNCKEWRTFGEGQILSDESSVGGVLGGHKMQADKVTEGNRDGVDQVLDFRLSPDAFLGLHSEPLAKRASETLGKRHIRGRSDGLRKNASFHGFASSPAVETLDMNETSWSQSATQMEGSATQTEDPDGVLGSAGVFEEIEGETIERRKIRWDHYIQARKHGEKTVEKMRHRDAELQHHKEDLQLLYDASNAKFKQWAAGKEGNIRALLSNLQHVLWPESSWQPIPLSGLIEVPDVKKAYRKATLFFHPDKMQQKGATVQQKFIAEKVFDLLQAAWKTFSLQEAL